MDHPESASGSLPARPEAGQPPEEFSLPADFRQLVDSAIPLFILDRTGHLQYASDAFCRYVGLGREEVLGRHCCELWANASASDCRLLLDVIDVDSPSQSVFHRRLRDGRTVTFQVSAVPHHGPGGEVIGVVAALSDISAHVRNERILAAQRDLAVALSAVQGLEHGMRLAVQAAVEISSMTGGGVYFVNEASGSLELAYSQGLPRGQAARLARFSPTSMPTQAVRRGKPSYGCDALIDSEDSETDCSGFWATAIVPFSPEAQVIGCLIVGAPECLPVPEYARGALEAIAAQIGIVAARLKAEALVIDAQQTLLELEVQEKDRVSAELDRIRERLVRQTQLATIGQLTGSIAHELRNPLGVIRNAAFLLERKMSAGESTLHRYLEIIEQETISADRIITELMAMTRGEAPKKSAIDLGHLFDLARERLGEVEGIEWQYETDEDPFPIFVDPSQAEQVLRNLLANAAQAQDGGGWVRVMGRREGAFDVITVADGGSGIPEALRQQIFEPLFTTKPKGTGLGLAICRQIAERHGGTLEAPPSSGGAVFELRLPRQS